MVGNGQNHDFQAIFVCLKLGQKKFTVYSRCVRPCIDQCTPVKMFLVLVHQVASIAWPLGIFLQFPLV